MADNDFTTSGTKRDPKTVRKHAIESVRMSFNDDIIKKPVFEEDKNKGFVKYGEKNLFPEFLLGLYMCCGKHAAIINRKIKMIAGKGFDIENEMTKNELGLYSGKKTAKLLASDLEIMKGFAYLVRWDAKKTKPLAYDYVPFKSVRIGIEEGTFYISDDWSSRKAKDKPVMYYEYEGKAGLDKIDKNLKKEDQEELLRLQTVELVYFVDVSAGTDTYPIPNYYPSVEWILTDSETSKYSLNLVLNDFLGGFHIGFKNGIPEENEREQEKKSFEKEYTGSNGKRIIITFSEPGSEGVDLNPLPSAGNEDILAQTEERAQNNIFIAHEVVSPMLFGIRVEGQLGGRNEMVEALEIFQAVYIDDQQELINESLNKLFKDMGSTEEVRLKKYTIDGANSSIINS